MALQFIPARYCLLTATLATAGALDSALLSEDVDLTTGGALDIKLLAKDDDAELTTTGAFAACYCCHYQLPTACYLLPTPSL